jgi:hypothetical protein
VLAAKVELKGFPEAIARLNQIQSALGDRVAIDTVNRLAAQAKTRMSELIREEYNISASLVRDRLRVRTAHRSGTFEIQAALIGNPESSGGKRAMNVIHFLSSADVKRGGPRKLKSGQIKQLQFKFKKGKGNTTIPGAFIGNSGRTVFIREDPTNSRSKIRAVYTIGVPQMFSTKKNVRAVVSFVQDNFTRIFADRARYYLGKL